VRPVSDHGSKMDWFDVAKGVGGLVLTVAMRLIFGRAMLAIDKKLSALGELNAIRADVAACREELAKLKSEVEALKNPNAPAPTPRVG
jgi:hypothetical protein